MKGLKYYGEKAFDRLNDIRSEGTVKSSAIVTAAAVGLIGTFLGFQSAHNSTRNPSTAIADFHRISNDPQIKEILEKSATKETTDNTNLKGPKTLTVESILPPETVVYRTNGTNYDTQLNLVQNLK